LTPERILETSEHVLRRYGPAKATVVDVARELGVSHGSVYRHFPSKAALRDAVAERWLVAVSEPLAEIANEDGAAAERLRRWLELLASSKQDRARDDPELFATYVEVITEHVDGLVAQLARIIADGIEQGVFAATDAQAAGRAVFDATARFHNPANSVSWADPRIAADYEQVISLIIAGLSARA
jgi:AcrR family transcriptional regulator